MASRRSDVHRGVAPAIHSGDVGQKRLKQSDGLYSTALVPPGIEGHEVQEECANHNEDSHNRRLMRGNRALNVAEVSETECFETLNCMLLGVPIRLVVVPLPSDSDDENAAIQYTSRSRTQPTSRACLMGSNILAVGTLSSYESQNLAYGMYSQIQEKEPMRGLAQDFPTPSALEVRVR